jgi:hypothetical protein
MTYRYRIIRFTAIVPKYGGVSKETTSELPTRFSSYDIQADKPI